MRKKNDTIAILLISFMIISIGFLSGCNEQEPEGSDPIINYFTTTPAYIYFGNATILNWSVENATSVSIDQGIGKVSLNGSLALSPIQNQTYTLTATNSYGVTNKSTIVYIYNSPVNNEDIDSLVTGKTMSFEIINVNEDYDQIIFEVISADEGIAWDKINIFWSNTTDIGVCTHERILRPENVTPTDIIIVTVGVDAGTVRIYFAYYGYIILISQTVSIS